MHNVIRHFTPLWLRDDKGTTFRHVAVIQIETGTFVTDVEDSDSRDYPTHKKGLLRDGSEFRSMTEAEQDAQRVFRSLKQEDWRTVHDPPPDI